MGKESGGGRFRRGWGSSWGGERGTAEREKRKAKSEQQTAKGEQPHAEIAETAEERGEQRSAAWLAILCRDP
jgi:hypothetical protein